MPRSLRLQVPHGSYHVFCRGPGELPIFRDDVDRRLFLTLLGAGVGRLDWTCYAFCLMTTHYHLVVRTKAPDLARGMQWLNGSFAQTFNRRHGSAGHVFGGRYGSRLAEGDPQLLEACRYVDLNPVRAGICTDPAEWPWNSYRFVVEPCPAPPFLAVDAVLSYFGGCRERARELYRAFVADAPPRAA